MEKTIKEQLKDLLDKYSNGSDFDVLIPPDPKFGDYSTNLAFLWAKKESKNPKEVGEELALNLQQDLGFQKYFSKIEAAGNGFVNFYISDDYAKKQLKSVCGDSDFGCHTILKGTKVMVEFTDPNPFKLFHVGHVMANAIGESISRLYEALGAKVIRVNYQGDTGLHVAKTIWAILNTFKDKYPKDSDSLKTRIVYLGEAYADGSYAYTDDRGGAKTEIEQLNKTLYDRSDKEINEIYDQGKKWSLEYFETIYKKLGTKFDHYFFESEAAQDGLEIINKNKDVFIQSEKAIIFKGENYGLHTRVFVNAYGLPTYEAKELGVNKKKFDLYSPDLSIIVTGNEINDYFKVLLKAMELTLPKVAERTKHIGHGMMRFASGKMSSRTGDVITAESILELLIERIKEVEKDKKSQEEHLIQAVAAMKYQILNHSIGQDIIFDFEKALSLTGDAAPYIQYTYARLKSIIRKSGFLYYFLPQNTSKLNLEQEKSIIKQILSFPDTVKEAAELHSANNLTSYLFKLSSLANNYYESVRILNSKFSERGAKLLLIKTAAAVIKRGLYLLGIKTLEKI